MTISYSTTPREKRSVRWVEFMPQSLLRRHVGDRADSRSRTGRHRSGRLSGGRSGGSTATVQPCGCDFSQTEVEDLSVLGAREKLPGAAFEK